MVFLYAGDDVQILGLKDVLWGLPEDSYSYIQHEYYYSGINPAELVIILLKLINDCIR